MTLAVATISRVKEPKTSHEVQFNPPSLKISLSNRLQDEEQGGKGGQPRQNTRVTTSKLETELVYDTTEAGEDVRQRTRALKDMALADPATKAGQVPSTPALVVFRWGNFKFEGVIESLSETLDFWAAEGVPLRSTIQISLQGLNAFADGNAEKTLVTATLNKIGAGGTGTTGSAAAAGDPGAGRAVAAQNGIEDMRMPTGGAVAVSASVNLQAAAGFSASAGASAGVGASAGAGFGIGASASASASAGFGASAGASFGASASAGFGASASAGFGASASAGFSAGASARFGASASAGVGASAGAFAGLGTSKTSFVSVRVDPARLLPAPPVRVGSATGFDVTGRAISEGSAGLTANVSARAGVRIG